MIYPLRNEDRRLWLAHLRFSGCIVVLSLVLLSLTGAEGQRGTRLPTSSLPSDLQRTGLPSIPATIAPSEFLVAGPFLAGSREGMIDFATVVGGEEVLQPREGDELPSWMVQGGVTRWRRVPAKEGATDAEFTGVDWDALQDHWGWAGGFYIAYAYTEVEVNRASRALAIAERVSSFQVNGLPYPGDIYGHNFLRVPVELKAGKNRILIRFGRGDRINFVFRLEPVPSDLIALTGDVTYGNPVIGSHLDILAAVPVINTTDETISDGAIRLSWTVAKQGESVRKEMPPLAPYSVFKPHLWLRSDSVISESDLIERSLPVKVELMRGNRVVSTVEVGLRAVAPGEPRRIAFVSRIDQSLQVFSIRWPQPYDRSQKYGLIMSLHGAGASDEGQVLSYAPKDWAFVMAPTNRRNFGFDWQDWGRLDALEALEFVLQNFPVDPDRVYLTGHSMGGHGTWHIGLKHADRFAAIAPSAGWTDFSLYVPPFTRRSFLFSSPALNAIWLTAFAPDLFPLTAGNALNLKVLSLVGGKDEQVPPVHLRMATDILRKAGVDAAMMEVPGQGHWFDFAETPGTDCTDNAAFMEMFRATRRDANPRRVSFYSADLADNDGLYWVKVHEPVVFGDPVRVFAEIRGSSQIQVSAENVRAMTLSPQGLLRDGKITIRVNGVLVTSEFRATSGVTLMADGTGWKIGDWEPAPHRKSPHLSGPIKRAYFSPFLIVYADGGTAEETEIYQRLAVNEAFVWYWRGNGIAPVIPESRFFDPFASPFRSGNFNVIIYGTPQSSAFIREQFAQMPFPVGADSTGLEFAGRRYEGARVGLKMVYPLRNGKEPTNRLVVYNTGTSAHAVLDVARWPVLYSGSALPDFIITGPEARDKGWGGLFGAGFFDLQWLPQGPHIYLK
jgi:pimeloyl-ACP methyl ester carboxylesterase